MGNFLDDINKAKQAQETKNNEVINEIASYFRQQLNSEDFENKLKERIISNIQDGKKETKLYIEFWEYHSGCSGTNFSVSCCKDWAVGYKYDYKGIRLLNISEQVVGELKYLLCSKLDRLDLKYWLENTTGGRFNYPTYEFHINI